MSQVKILIDFFTSPISKGSKDFQMNLEVQLKDFQKYLINEKGHFAKVISPQVLPTDASIVHWINW